MRRFTTEEFDSSPNVSGGKTHIVNDFTAIHLAARDGLEDILELLLAAGRAPRGR